MVIISIIIITDRMLLRSTSLSCDLGLENVLFICVWKVQFSRKCFMKMGNLPYRPRSLSMPYGHDAS